MIRHRSALALAGLLAGCAHALPPQSPPGPRPGGSAYTPRAHPPHTLSGVRAPAPALPGDMPGPGRTPDPAPSWREPIRDLRPDPEYDPLHPYPAPDPALPPDARAT